MFSTKHGACFLMAKKKYEVEYCDYCTLEIHSDIYHIKKLPYTMQSHWVKRYLGGREMNIETKALAMNIAVTFCERCKKFLDKGILESIKSEQ